MTDVYDRAQEMEQDVQFGAPVASGASLLLRPDHLAAGGSERGLLQGKVLVSR